MRPAPRLEPLEDYYQNGNYSACGTIHSPLSTTVCCHFGVLGCEGELKPSPLGRAIILTPLAGLREKTKIPLRYYLFW
ncbi:MAG: hypothetical protein LBE12_00340 [Planctomycetaceae bacterium]|nr:hypothetical protein [Planctomycetaceae bacterium]